MPAGDTIKDISTMREVLRECSVFGNKTREDFGRNPRHELAKIDQWLYMYKHEFRDRENRKHVFLALDARDVVRNPLYAFFKIKSFKDNDIRFHFGLLDVLWDGGERSLDEIEESLGRTGIFDIGVSGRDFETSILRRKLEEYVGLGLLRCRKDGRRYVYALSPNRVDLRGWAHAVRFFSERSLLGVIGSFVLDRVGRMSALARLDGADCDVAEGALMRENASLRGDAPFVFRHHYIHHALDSEIVLSLLEAISGRCAVTLICHSRSGARNPVVAVPLRLYQSVQSGRLYLLLWDERRRRPAMFRVDRIAEVKDTRQVPWFDRCLETADRLMTHVWGVSLPDRPRMQHLAMTVRGRWQGDFILTRLFRERRIGRVTRLDELTARFEVDTYDVMELMPWVRTFIGNIAEISCSDAAFLDTFYCDLRRSFAMYAEDADDPA